MKPLDEPSRKIIKELILNPRSSDNQISKITGIPLKTVNRKRKKLEESGNLRYYTHLDLSTQGTGLFHGRDLYLVTLKTGITKDMFMSGLAKFSPKYVYVKHILESFVGEKNGRVVLMFVLESPQPSDLIEIFNAEIVPDLNDVLGKDCIHSIDTLQLTHQISRLHNYSAERIINKKHPKNDKGHEMIFVDD